MKFVAEKGGKLSLFLKQEKGFSHKTLMLLKNAQGVLVNGAPVFMNYMLKPGDEVSLVFPPEAPSDVAPRDLPFCVVFEDEALLVVNKPPGQSVYPCAPGEESSLANAAAYYYQENGIFAPFRPVGRLDRGTSGLMLIAKNKHAATVLSRQRQKKTYYAVLQGELSLSRGGISLPLGPQEGSAICQGVDFNRGKSAATAFRILGAGGGLTLAEVQIFTGRTHQIRAHFAHIGYPLYGDFLYGTENSEIARPPLHAGVLSFCHPLTRQPLCFAAPLPGDMKNLLANHEIFHNL